ncbi:MAG: SIMPL domain-containing protein [Salinigranum sp.]
MSSSTLRRALAALALATLLLTAGCTGYVGNAADSAGNGGAADAAQSNPNVSPSGVAPSTGGAAAAAGSTVSVGGSGEVTADPDRAVLQVAVQVTADSASAARQRVAENVSSLRQALADAGVPEANVTTEYYNIRQIKESPRSPPPEKSPATSGTTRYRAVHALSIEIDDVSRVGEIIQVAVENGATDVQRVEFTLSDDRRAELRDRALRRAMANARDDADVLASAANLELDGVRSASTGGVDVRPYRAQTTAAAASGGAPTHIDSGPVTVSAHVQVTYNASG